jgi:hypothetical protein
MANHVERRQSSRRRFESLLYVEVEPGNGGMVLNLSEHGFGFRAVRRVRPRQEVKFAFNLDEKRRTEGRGRLEWCDLEGRVAGVKYTDVSDEFLSEMRKWMGTAVEYPMQNGDAAQPNGESSSSSPVPPAVLTATNGNHSYAAKASASGDRSPSTNGHDRPTQPSATKSVRSITSAPSAALVSAAVTFLSAPETKPEPLHSETSNKRDASGKWTSLPPAVGVERKPTPSRPQLAQGGSEFSTATAHKLDHVEHAGAEGDFELAEDSSESSWLSANEREVSTQDRSDPLADLEERTVRALNEHAQALLQHFQHEEQRTLAAFREAAVRVLRDSERQLFPIRESAQAQIKSLESAVAAAGASVKVLDRYPSLLERAQQQALDRFQMQVQEILHAHVTELRRRSEAVFEQLNTQTNSAGLLPGRIKTSSGIIVTAVLVMLLIGLFVFRREASAGFIWLGQQMTEPAPVSERAKTSPAPAAKPPVAETTPPITDNKPEVTEDKQAGAEAKAAEEPPDSTVSTVPPADSKPRVDTWAQRVESVKSLWDQVGKGNVTAMLTLGNMYFTGHGVSKNCYQARRLFAAAARKGSLEGKQRLAELDRSNCP